MLLFGFDPFNPRPRKMINAIQLSEYILTQTKPEKGDIISNLTLQKLLYYCQGFHLALKEMPFFKDLILHWDNGPAVRYSYYHYEKYGEGALPVPKDFDDSIFSTEEKEIVHDVLIVYGQFSGGMLHKLTCSEPPWKESQPNEKITNDALHRHFSTQVKTRIK